MIGKSGVGKSSLISHVFGVENAFAPHYDKPGEDTIDHEFISPHNHGLVIHDSKGFEPGEEANLKMVRDFIDRRKNMPLEHQLHAIWLCFEIPRGGGPLVEAGVEEFLTLKRSGMLGNVPVIVVFTKYDMLINNIEHTLHETSVNELSDEAIKELTTKKAEAELQNICIRPLPQIAGLGIPHVKVSVHEEYKETLIDLVDTTKKCVHQYSAAAATVMAFVAQQIDPKLKIKASIEVGKTRWKALARWKVLAGWKALVSHTAITNYDVLHTDIINVWNLNDPHDHLLSQEFRALMTNVVEVGRTKGHQHSFLDHAVLQHFTSYIVHLTLVLQTLYLVSKHQELTPRVIKLAILAYVALPIKGESVTWIQECNGQLATLECVDQDSLDKIEEIMQYHSIDAEEVSKLREKIPLVNCLPDEPWFIEKS